MVEVAVRRPNMCTRSVPGCLLRRLFRHDMALTRRPQITSARSDERTGSGDLRHRRTAQRHSVDRGFTLRPTLAMPALFRFILFPGTLELVVRQGDWG